MVHDDNIVFNEMKNNLNGYSFLLNFPSQKKISYSLGIDYYNYLFQYQVLTLTDSVNEKHKNNLNNWAFSFNINYLLLGKRNNFKIKSSFEILFPLYSDEKYIQKENTNIANEERIIESQNDGFFTGFPGASIKLWFNYFPTKHWGIVFSPEISLKTVSYFCLNAGICYR